MCEPMSIAALAATVVGSLVQAQGQRQAVKAQRSVQQAETARQDGYRKESMGYWDQAANAASRENQDATLQAKTDERGQKYAGAVKDFDINTDMLFGQQSSPAVVGKTVASEIGQSVEDQRMEGWRKALLDAWGDTTQQNAIGNAHTGSKIDMMGRFSQGSSGVLPMELEAAKQKGAGTRQLGSMLSAAGTVMGMGAGMAGGMMGGAATGPTMMGTTAAKMGVGPWSMPAAGIYSIPLP